MSDQWIVIPNWEKFQHYRDRQPTWIKLYTELNSRDEWLELTDSERGLLVMIWIEFARSKGRLKVDRVPAGVRQRNRRRALKRLSDAGFLRISASPEVEKEKKDLVIKRKRKDLVIKRKSRNRAKRDAPELLNFPEYLETLH